MAAAFGRWAASARESESELDVSDLVEDPRYQALCVLTPAQIQGPYFVDVDLVRSNLTEGRPGFPTRLWISVVRAATCAPIAGASVEIWHADALGVYSGIAALGTAGQTFLRGTQFTDPSGVAIFDTLLPGWYPGRTAHLHLKTRAPGSPTLTTQLYFVQPLIDRVHARRPYALNGPGPVTNSSDGFYDPLTRMTTLGQQQGVLHLEFTVGVP
jgi:protocatechuate 3,4-dioxygenase beta subunit